MLEMIHYTLTTFIYVDGQHLERVQQRFDYDEILNSEIQKN